MFGDYHNPNDFWRPPMQNDDMNDEDRMAMGIVQGIVFFALIMSLMLMCALFGSCTTERVVMVEKVRTDTLREYRNVHDSIYVHDSVSVKEKGDTVWVEKWHTKIRAKELHDTIYKARVDSVPVPYPVEKLVEKKLSWFQKTMMGVGILTLMALVVFVGVKLKRFLP